MLGVLMTPEATVALGVVAGALVAGPVLKHLGKQVLNGSHVELVICAIAGVASVKVVGPQTCK